jgi:hypothetical protein
MLYHFLIYFVSRTSVRERLKLIQSINPRTSVHDTITLLTHPPPTILPSAKRDKRLIISQIRDLK